MPTYKLVYFNLTGLAESARFLFAYGGIDFEDCRVEREEWPAIKPTFPLGQLPVLDVNGTQINQSLAITRYLGKVVKLSGKNDLEDAIIDAAALNVTDLRIKFSGVTSEKDEVVKKQKREEFKNELIPAFCKQVEKILATNGGYLALGRLTWADIYFAALSGMFKRLTKESFNSAPVEEYLEKICAIPKIKKWIETRPADPEWWLGNILSAYGGIDFEDCRVEREEWPAIKPTFPLGQLPVLDVNGTQINQSLAITRYLGKVVKLSGKNDLEDAIIDAAALNVTDLRIKFSGVTSEKDEVVKKQKREEFKNELIPAFCKQVEKILATNGGYLALGRLTWADIYFAALSGMFKRLTKESFNSAPVEEYLEKICAIPKIKKWIETRPADPEWWLGSN